MDTDLMELTTIELRKLTATDGMTLTNGETYAREVYLGCNDTPQSWHEVPLEQVPPMPSAVPPEGVV